jgi:hypothetical protein
MNPAPFEYRQPIDLAALADMIAAARDGHG